MGQMFATGCKYFRAEKSIGTSVCENVHQPLVPQKDAARPWSSKFTWPVALAGVVKRHLSSISSLGRRRPKIRPERSEDRLR
jgi:hypothetical protein